jgi:hypothetical protein
MEYVMARSFTNLIICSRMCVSIFFERGCKLQAGQVIDCATYRWRLMTGDQCECGWRSLLRQRTYCQGRTGTNKSHSLFLEFDLDSA